LIELELGAAKRLVFCFADATSVHGFFLKDSLGQFDGPLRFGCYLRIAGDGDLRALRPGSVPL
jgi:hypothetical protein